MSRRTERVSELLREEISSILHQQVKDPRLGLLFSVTTVEVSPDLRHARVFISVMADEREKESAFQALAAATAFVRRELRSRLTSLRYTPELAFVRDDSIERGARLSALINQALGEQGPPA
jgi:ribosome-binding factor A